MSPKHFPMPWRARAEAVLPASFVLAGLVWLAFHSGGYFASATAIGVIAVGAALVLWITLADEPFGALNVPLVIALGAGVLLAAWVLASSRWSGSAARSLIEFNRVLLYVLATAFVGLAASRSRGPAEMVRVATLATVAVVTCGLVTRVLPEVWPTATGLQPDRLGYPLSYWNALGLMAAFAFLGCLHLSASLDERRWLRVVAAAGCPVAAGALFFTFSRGAIVALALGLVVYVVIARPRALPAALVACIPASIATVVAAYDADALARAAELTSPAAIDQGRRMAVVLALAVLSAVGIRAALVATDHRVASIVRRLAPPRRVLAALAVGLVGLVLAGGAAADAPERVQDQVERFAAGDDIGTTGDRRDRLTELGNNGRIEHWRVALAAFDREPVHGEGAGTYPIAWARDRRSEFSVTEGHGLPQELLGELGIVGGVLLALFLGGLAAGAVRRLRGPERTAVGAAVALFVVWGARSTIDWDWEMPAVTLAVLLPVAAAAGGTSSPRLGRWSNPRRFTRVLLGLGCLILLQTPVGIARSQEHLDRAGNAFAAGDCRTAIAASIASSRALGVRPEPFEYLGYCDVRFGRPDLAVRAFEAAVRRDPENWRVHYGLALVQAANGQDPRPRLLRARELNPLEAVVEEAQEDLAEVTTPRGWRRASVKAELPF